MKEQETRPDLVDEVSRIFRANGFHGTTMSVISERTGLGRSSIYHHFGRGKSEMAHRSLDRIGAFIDVIAATTRAADVPPRVKWQSIEGLLRKHYEDGELGCLLAVFALEDIPGDLRERTKALFDRWIEAVADLYRTSGISEEEAKQSAQRDVAAIQGGLILSRAQSSSRPFDRALADVTAAVSELLDGKHAP